MENLRHSLGQKVLMLNPEDGLAAGTTKHCISCFKDRSQSPVRGSIGDLATGLGRTFHGFHGLAEELMVIFILIQPSQRPSLKKTAAPQPERSLLWSASGHADPLGKGPVEHCSEPLGFVDGTKVPWWPYMSRQLRRSNIDTLKVGKP